MPGEPWTDEEREHVRASLIDPAYQGVYWTNGEMADALATVDALTRKVEEKEAEMARYKAAHCFTAPLDVFGCCALCGRAMAGHADCVLTERNVELRDALRERVTKAQEAWHYFKGSLGVNQETGEPMGDSAGAFAALDALLTPEPTASTHPTPPGEKEPDHA